MPGRDCRSDPKILEKIQKYMSENKPRMICPTSMNMFSNSKFIFPDGSSIDVDTHDGAAEIVGRELGLKHIKKTADLEMYGIARTGCMTDAFYFNAHMPPTKKAEETVMDQIVRANPTMVIARLHDDYKDQETALRKRLDRKLEMEVV